MWTWYTGRWWVGCYIWYSEEGPGWAAASPSPLLAVPNVTAHPSTANVPITVLLYDGLLLCGFNVAIEGLNSSGFDGKMCVSAVSVVLPWRQWGTAAAMWYLWPWLPHVLYQGLPLTDCFLHHTCSSILHWRLHIFTVTGSTIAFYDVSSSASLQ